MDSMISSAMNDKLNAQVTSEFAASHMYLAMACAMEGEALKVLSGFFYRQSNEERDHAMKLLKYICDVGGAVKLDAVPKPAGDFTSPMSAFKQSLEAEQKVTRQIHELMSLAESEKDYATRNFLQWYVDEQVEEVSTFSDLVQLAERAKDTIQLELAVRNLHPPQA